MRRSFIAQDSRPRACQSRGHGSGAGTARAPSLHLGALPRGATLPSRRTKRNQTAGFRLPSAHLSFLLTPLTRRLSPSASALQMLLPWLRFASPLWQRGVNHHANRQSRLSIRITSLTSVPVAHDPSFCWPLVALQLCPVFRRNLILHHNKSHSSLFPSIPDNALPKCRCASAHKLVAAKRSLAA
ncbi:hypothetical protein IWX90DRAFT_436664 [Phyllosticta citrichinensis]|uniref:Uncharacterized protein n=1 Tax=Phyllosticta citrichinensis TaxID=1130410 RepID=A0ABR1XRR6_9PEZI